MKSIGLQRSRSHLATLLVATLGLVSSACSFHVSASTKTGADAKRAEGETKASSGKRSSSGDHSNKDEEKRESSSSRSSSGDGKSGTSGKVSIKASGKGGIIFATKGRTKDIARSSKGDDFAATDLVGGGTSGSGGGGKSAGGGATGGGKGAASGGGKASNGASGGGKGTDDKGSGSKGSDGKGSGSKGSGSKGSDGKGSNKGQKDRGEGSKDYESGSAQVQSEKRRSAEKAGAGREKNSQKPHGQEKAGAGREKNADKTSSKSGDKSKDTKKDVVVIDPPAQPPENAFGYEEPVRGCFEGVVYPLSAQTKRLPLDFSKLTGISVVYACEWDIPVRAWSQGFPGVADRYEWFAIQYKGSFAVEKAGVWEFRISSDDGAKLYIDGKLVLDNDGEHPPQERKAKLHLSKGDHDMVLQYFQGPRYHINLQLFASPPGEQEGIFSVR